MEDVSGIKTSILLREINHRQNLMDDGLCPYCKRPLVSHQCIYKDRPEDFHPNLYYFFSDQVRIFVNKQNEL